MAWNNIFQVLREKDSQLWILYLEKISFQEWRENTFSGKAKLRKFVINKYTLE